MDVRETVKTLVKQAVAAYLEANQESLQSSKPAITILLTYHASNPDEILKAITSIEEAFNITLVASKEWSARLNEKEALPIEDMPQYELQKLWRETDLLILPVASFGLVSKLALMMDDDKAVKTAVGFQLLGKPVIIAKDEVELGVYQQVLAPYSVQEKLQDYIRTLQKDKVKLVPLTQLTKTATEELSQLKKGNRSFSQSI